MASSKVMPSSTSGNSDLRRRNSSSSSAKSSSISDLHLHYNNNNNHNQNSNHKQRVKDNTKGSSDLGSMSIDGLVRNVFGDEQVSESALLDAQITVLDAAGAVTAIGDNGAGRKLTIRRQESAPVSSGRNVEDVWKDIVAGRSVWRQCKQELPDEMMTLEDYLAKAEAVEEDDIKMPLQPPLRPKLSGGVYPSLYSSSVEGVIGFENGVEVVGGRGKRRALMEPLDKAAQQRQRRMIKNRESAARSRERKQAYQVELESLAVKLEEENELLLKEMAEQTRERYKKLMEKVIPVEEERRRPKRLRRVCSMEW